MCLSCDQVGILIFLKKFQKVYSEVVQERILYKHPNYLSGAHHINLEEYLKCNTVLYIVTERCSFPVVREMKNQTYEVVFGSVELPWWLRR